MRFRFTEPAPADAEVFADLKIVRLTENERPCLKIWIGRSTRPSSYIQFKSPERREEYIAEQKAAATRRTAYKAERNAQLAESRKRLSDPAALIDGAKDGQRFSGAETAALIRYRLAKVFPDVKFKVHTEDSSTINVYWTLGPTDEAVKREVGSFAGQGFDGMIDMRYSYTAWLSPDGSAKIAHSEGTQGSAGVMPEINTDAPDPKAVHVHFGTDFVFTHREIPDDLRERVARDLCALQHVEYTNQFHQRNLLGEHDTEYLSTHVGRLLSETAFPTGAEYAGVEYSKAEGYSRQWARAVLKGEAVAAGKES